jgi:hypothetical protein
MKLSTGPRMGFAPRNPGDREGLRYELPDVDQPGCFRVGHSEFLIP